MSARDDELGELMGSALRERADRVDGEGVTLDGVRGTARTIRRRRRVAGALAAAAAVAVIVPTAMMAGGEAPQRPQPADAPEPFSVRLDRAAPGGEPPTVAWIQGRVLHTPDGESVQLARRYDSLTRFGETYLAGYQRTGDGSYAFDELAPDGSVASTQVTGSQSVQDVVVLSADGSVAAWTTPRGAVRVWTDAGVETVGQVPVTRGGGTGWVAAVRGEDGCTQECEVYVNTWDGRGRVTAFSTDGSERTLPRSITVVLARSIDGLLSVSTDRTAPNEVDSCVGVYDEPAGAYAWRSCIRGVGGFSPDGDWSDVRQPDTDGPPAGYLIREAASGEQHGALTTRGDVTNTVVGPLVWEDEEHYLLPARSADGDWMLVRGDLRGDITQVLPPERGGELYEVPWVLSDR